MSNTYFKFKQFVVNQDKCAMKVGTDGVLLGAWANHNIKNKILDIGTGTGLIALMASQRFPESIIYAIEINKNSYEQAKENIENSKFKKQINLINTSLQDYTVNNNIKFDLIISNPPFFENSLLSDNNDKNIARHNLTLSYNDLINYSIKLLSRQGALCIIIPFDNLDNIKDIANKNKLFVTEKIYVKTTPSKQPKRVLLKLEFYSRNYKPEELIIEESRHKYSTNFYNLIKDFYLDK